MSFEKFPSPVEPESTSETKITQEFREDDLVVVQSSPEKGPYKVLEYNDKGKVVIAKEGDPIETYDPEDLAMWNDDEHGNKTEHIEPELTNDEAKEKESLAELSSISEIIEYIRKNDGFTSEKGKHYSPGDIESVIKNALLGVQEGRVFNPKGKPIPRELGESLKGHFDALDPELLSIENATSLEDLYGRLDQLDVVVAGKLYVAQKLKEEIRQFLEGNNNKKLPSKIKKLLGSFETQDKDSMESKDKSDSIEIRGEEGVDLTPLVENGFKTKGFDRKERVDLYDQGKLLEADIKVLKRAGYVPVQEAGLEIGDIVDFDLAFGLQDGQIESDPYNGYIVTEIKKKEIRINRPNGWQERVYFRFPDPNNHIQKYCKVTKKSVEDYDAYATVESANLRLGDVVNIQTFYRDNTSKELKSGNLYVSVEVLELSNKNIVVRTVNGDQKDIPYGTATLVKVISRKEGSETLKKAERLNVVAGDYVSWKGKVFYIRSVEKGVGASLQNSSAGGQIKSLSWEDALKLTPLSMEEREELRQQEKNKNKERKAVPSRDNEREDEKQEAANVGFLLEKAGFRLDTDDAGDYIVVDKKGNEIGVLTEDMKEINIKKLGRMPLETILEGLIDQERGKKEGSKKPLTDEDWGGSEYRNKDGTIGPKETRKKTPDYNFETTFPRAKKVKYGRPVAEGEQEEFQPTTEVILKRGDVVRVQLDNGEIESDWIIIGFDIETGDVIVSKVEGGKTLNKQISQIELKKLNSVPDISDTEQDGLKLADASADTPPTTETAEVQEKTSEELLQELYEAREAYIIADKALKDTKKTREKPKWPFSLIRRKNKFVNEDELKIIETKLENTEKDYEETRAKAARQEYLSEVGEAKMAVEKGNLNESDLEKEMALVRAGIFEKFVLDEQDELAKERVGALGQRERTWFRERMEAYLRKPLWQRVLIGAIIGVVSYGIGAPTVGAATLVSLFGVRVARGLMSAKIGAITTGLVKTIGTGIVENYRQKEISKFNDLFGVKIEVSQEEDEFKKILNDLSLEYEKTVKEVNRRNSNIANWSIVAGVVVGGAAAYGLNGPFADLIGPKIGMVEASQGDPSTSTDGHGILPEPSVSVAGSNAGSVDVSAVSQGVHEPNFMDTEILPIGARGPEGAIIDHFKGNEDVARQFGWDGEKDLSKWAGIKAHQLWTAEAGEALKNVETIEKLKELGYSQDLKGFGEMMHRIGEGNVVLNNDGTIDLESMDYLSHRVSGVGEVIRPTIMAPEGVTEIPFKEGHELVAIREGGDISFSLDGEEFAKGTINQDGTFYIPHTEGAIDPDSVQAYNTARTYLEKGVTEPLVTPEMVPSVEVAPIPEIMQTTEAVLDPEKVLLENVNEAIEKMRTGVHGFTSEEFEKIYEIKVNELLEKNPANMNSLSNWDLAKLRLGEGLSREMAYKQFGLAQLIREFNPDSIDKEMTIERFLKNKFSE